MREAAWLGPLTTSEYSCTLVGLSRIGVAICVRNVRSTTWGFFYGVVEDYYQAVYVKDSVCAW